LFSITTLIKRFGAIKHVLIRFPTTNSHFINIKKATECWPRYFFFSFRPNIWRIA